MKPPKVVLYYPRCFGPTRPTVGRVPLPLIAASTFLARDKFKIVIAYDMLQKNSVDTVLKECEDAVCLGISAMTGYQIIDGLKVAKLVKKKYPDLPIVWGGWHPSLEPETTIKSPYVDIVVRGQGERTFYELVKALVEGRSLEGILGISFKNDGRIVHNPERPLEDINNFPPYPYYLIDVEKCLFNNEFGSRVINYVSAYGCVYRCGFCAELPVHKRRWLALDPIRMVDEIEELVKKYNPDVISFDDSEFFISKKRVKTFCEELLKRGLRIKWCNANGRIDNLLRYEDEMWDLIVKAGCKEILVGAESGFQKALDFMTKDLKVEQIIEFSKKCKKYGIKVCFSLCLGMPWSKDYEKCKKLIDEEIKHTMDIADKLYRICNRFRFLWCVFTPYPGSALYRKAIEIGWEPPKTLEEWGQWAFSPKQPIPPWITKEQVKLINMLGCYISYFLDRDSYYWTTERVNNPFFRLIFKGIFRISEIIALIRWRLRFFKIPIDYRIYLWARDHLKVA